MTAKVFKNTVFAGSSPRDQVSIPGQVTMDMLRKKWHRCRIFAEEFNIYRVGINSPALKNAITPEQLIVSSNNTLLVITEVRRLAVK
jgi:hypothetical protein